MNDMRNKISVETCNGDNIEISIWDYYYLIIKFNETKDIKYRNLSEYILHALVVYYLDNFSQENPNDNNSQEYRNANCLRARRYLMCIKPKKELYTCQESGDNSMHCMNCQFGLSQIKHFEKCELKDYLNNRNLDINEIKEKLCDKFYSYRGYKNSFIHIIDIEKEFDYIKNTHSDNPDGVFNIDDAIFHNIVNEAVTIKDTTNYLNIGVSNIMSGM